ncbi:MAG: hypothetical protein P1V51_14655 [Deltaproteobacteria bacterium]|nr:hypothetical protein [Deltaproteobacteria bacterium]
MRRLLLAVLLLTLGACGIKAPPRPPVEQPSAEEREAPPAPEADAADEEEPGADAGGEAEAE